MPCTVAIGSASATTGCATCTTCATSTSTGTSTGGTGGTGDSARAADRLCELNVIEQVRNVCATTITRDAWERGQELTVHGWIYGLHDGLLRDLGTTVSAAAEAEAVHESAIAALS